MSIVVSIDRRWAASIVGRVTASIARRLTVCLFQILLQVCCTYSRKFDALVVVSLLQTLLDYLPCIYCKFFAWMLVEFTAAQSPRLLM
jgi:hypothetical protein